MERQKEQLAPVFAHSDAERDRFIDDATKEYEPVGDPVERSLGSFEPVRVSFERGDCVAVSVRLGQGAEFSEQAHHGLAFVFVHEDGTQAQGSPGVYGRGGVASEGCALAPGSVSFGLRTFLASRGRVQAEVLGEGPVSVQVHRKTLSEDEVSAMEAKVVGCALCKGAYQDCLSSGYSQDSCDEQANACVGRLAGQAFKEECW